jgi:hypothetical protein
MRPLHWRLSIPIVDVTDYGVDPRRGGMPYLVMEYLEGRTIRQVLRDRPCLAFPDAARLLGAVAAAIDCAHDHDIVHGDLKPANLFLARQPDGSEIAKVVDFGLAPLPAAEAEDARATAGDAIKGTPAYMAPELFERRGLSRQSDRFAFGILAYEMLTEYAPFGRSIYQVRDQQSGPTESHSSANPGLPAELDALFRVFSTEFLSCDIIGFSGRVRDGIRMALRSAAPLAGANCRAIRVRGCRLVAVLIAGWLASWREIRILESRTVDGFYVAAKHPPDPHLVVVTLDDAALAEDPRPWRNGTASFPTSWSGF